MKLSQHITTTANALYDATLSTLYPMPCKSCESFVDCRADAPVCAACWSEARIFEDSDLMCWKCGAISPGGKLARASVPIGKSHAVRCRRCDDEQFTAARSAGAYAGAIRATVISMKSEPHVGERAIEMLADWLRREPLNAATRIIPVPLHAEKFKQRGFNQAAILGERLSKRVSLPFDDASLTRSVYTAAHRAGMDAQARRDSVTDAFEIARPRLVRDEKIVLIDDVFTTGATVSACAQALKDAGAKDVFVLTLARAGLGNDV